MKSVGRILLTSDYSATIAKKLFVILSGTAAAALIARYLGPELRAEYAYIQNGAAILVVILNFGMSNYYQSLRREQGPRQCAAFVALTVKLTTLLMLGALLLGGLIDAARHAMLVVACFSLLRLQFQAVGLIENIRGASIATMLGSSVEVICIILLWIFAEPSARWVVGGFICKELAITILSLMAIVRAPDQIALRNGSSLFSLRSLMQTKVIPTLQSTAFRSVPMFILTIAIAILYKADVLIQSELHVDPAQIGIYVIGVLLAEYLWIFSDIFKDVQTSRTARGGAVHGVAAAHRSAILLTLVFYVAFISFGSFATKMVFGEEFSDSYYVAILILIANIFMIPAKILGAYLISTYDVKTYIIMMIIAVFVNIFLNFVLIPYLGVYGSIIANIMSYMIAGLGVTWIFVSRANVSIGELLLVGRQDFAAIAAQITGKGSTKAAPPLPPTG